MFTGIFITSSHSGMHGAFNSEMEGSRDSSLYIMLCSIGQGTLMLFSIRGYVQLCTGDLFRRVGRRSTPRRLILQ